VKENTGNRSSKLLRRAAIAIVATGTVAAPAAYASPSRNIIVVPPTDLPELARQTGEAMLLHTTIEGMTLLYIEQNQGTRLAIFDVTDPAHVKGEGSVQLDAPGPFDFVSTLENRAEVILIRFRQGQGSALLDVYKVKHPTLTKVQGLTLQGRTTALGDDGFTVSSQADSTGEPTRDVQVVDLAGLGDLNQVIDVKEVREELTKPDTGTTFLLTQRGLYEIRRTVVEKEYKLHERDLMLRYAGASG
jgi:hypothetical protein